VKNGAGDDYHATGLRKVDQPVPVPPAATGLAICERITTSLLVFNEIVQNFLSVIKHRGIFRGAFHRIDSDVGVIIASVQLIW
jgi:hypothetical protein